MRIRFVVIAGDPFVEVEQHAGGAALYHAERGLIGPMTIAAEPTVKEAYEQWKRERAAGRD